MIIEISQASSQFPDLQIKESYSNQEEQDSQVLTTSNLQSVKGNMVKKNDGYLNFG